MCHQLRENSVSVSPSTRISGIPTTTISEGFKGGTRGAPILPRDAVSRTANVERNGGHKWVNYVRYIYIYINYKRCAFYGDYTVYRLFVAMLLLANRIRSLCKVFQHILTSIGLKILYEERVSILHYMI